MMKRFVAAFAMALLACSPVLAQTSEPSTGRPYVIPVAPIGTYANGARALSTSPVDVWAANPARIRALLLNNSGIGISGGSPIVEWCRWGTVAGAPAAVGGVGSFALQPNGGGRDDQGAGVNQGPLNCLSESGTPLLYAEQY
jgi:hypothetical protein